MSNISRNESDVSRDERWTFANREKKLIKQDKAISDDYDDKFI